MSTKYGTYVQEELGCLAGKTVWAVREMTYEEKVNMGWEPCCDDGVVIVFSDGTLMVPMRDPEGNGPGWPLVDTPDLPSN